MNYTCFNVDPCEGSECDPPPESVCFLAVEVGPCEEYFRRYYYNSDTGLCKEFAGCGGNGNSFETLEQCEEACDGEKL